jgi:hypothetical protein
MTLYDWTPDRLFHFVTGVLTGVLIVQCWLFFTSEE